MAHSSGVYREWELSHRKDEVRAQRLVRLYDNLSHLIQYRPFEVIGAEDSSYGSPYAGIKAMHNELLGVLKLFAAQNELPLYLYKPSEIKKFATGVGNADKDAMVAACRKRLRIKTDSNNVADAAWVLQMTKREVW